jgi:signal transduction histidine kinase
MVNRTALDPQTPRSSARWPRAADAVLAIVVFLAIVFVSFEGPNDEFAIRSLSDVSIAAFFVYAVASGALYWRRYQPLVVLGVTLVASALPMRLGYSETVGIAMLVALYSVGRYATNDQWSYVGVGAAFALVAITPLIDEGVTAAEIGFGVFVMFVVWYIGRRMWIRGERAAQLEREQAAEARRVVAEERTRIARELHDVVAHRVSMMTVQAGAAKTVAADDPEGALQAMEEVEKAGHQALGELRHLLGVLRPEAEVDGLGPPPGLADVPRLVEQFARAGLDVSLTMDGLPTDLPTRVDLSAYRIVQEALTNVLKHAGPSARTEVRLSIDNHEVAIEVLDNGHGDTTLPGSGHGILGMRERALLLGGSLDAGPRTGGGFQVVAHLPIWAEPA